MLPTVAASKPGSHGHWTVLAFSRHPSASCPLWPPAHNSHQRKGWFLHSQRSPEWSLRVALALWKELVEVSIWLGSQLTPCCKEGTLSAECSGVQDLQEVPCRSHKVLRSSLGAGDKFLILGPVKTDSNKYKAVVGS